MYKKVIFLICYAILASAFFSHAMHDASRENSSYPIGTKIVVRAIGTIGALVVVAWIIFMKLQ